MSDRSDYKKGLLKSVSNKYFFDRRTKMVHDRSCEMIDNIPDSDITAMKKLPDPINIHDIAPCCYRRLMIRLGIPDYCPNVDMKLLVGFFDSLGATDYQLKVLFLDLKTFFLFQTSSKAILYVKDDSWKIEMLPDGKLKLLHNNYKINKIAYTRRFARGYNMFHEQHNGRGESPSFDDIYKTITRYSWDDHIKYLKGKNGKLRGIISLKRNLGSHLRAQPWNGLSYVAYNGFNAGVLRSDGAADGQDG